jgi:hypothetical protein
MTWTDFVKKVQNELRTGEKFFDLNVPFEQEHLLTRTIVVGLRTLFADSYDVRGNPAKLHYHVVYRNGDVEEDRQAWNSVRSEKWIQMHGVRYVPDILVRRRLDTSTDILPIEVKYIKKTASTQALATALGQSLVYSVRYPQSIAFVGVKRSIEWGRYRLNLSTQANEAALHKKLEQNGICLILREVGM